MNKLSKVTENSNDPIKIGLDLHGVIDSMPEFFAFFTKAMISAGAEIHIITGGTTNEDTKLLEDYGIEWTHIFSLLDHHTKMGTPTSGIHPKHGFPMVSDSEWDKTKGEYCRKNNISLHIDDTIAYNEFFTTPFSRLWTNSKKTNRII